MKITIEVDDNVYESLTKLFAETKDSPSTKIQISDAVNAHFRTLVMCFLTGVCHGIRECTGSIEYIEKHDEVLSKMRNRGKIN